MQKLLILSVLIATVVIPAVAAREQSAKRGMKRALLLMLGFNVIYLLGLRFVYPRLF